MKRVFFFLTNLLIYHIVIAQNNLPAISIHHVKPLFFQCSGYESPAYIDSALFARYLDWQLQSDSLPVKQSKNFAIEIWYIISKEGKIFSAKSPKNIIDELTAYILNKLLNCPYQWSPAYHNGRPVNSFHKIIIEW